MEVKHKHVIDLTDRQTVVTMDAVQGDSGRILELEILSAGEVWPLPEELAVKIRYQKPDGTGGIYDTLPDGSAAWCGEGNVLTVALAPEVCAAAGRVLLQLHLMQGATQLTTFAMGLRVQPEVEAPEVSGDYTNLSAWLETTGKRILTEEDQAMIEQLAETTAEFAEKAADVDASLEAIQQGRENGEFDGKSAYELAVENGFVGTEEEWLASLKGEQGEKGDKGDLGGIDSQFIAEYGVTTNAEIEAAYQAGKQVICHAYNGLYYPMTYRKSATQHYFARMQSTTYMTMVIKCLDDDWQEEYCALAKTTGATMTGKLTLSGDPTSALHAATKQYVDNCAAKIATGTYVGTNEVGADYPNSLTFDFVPKILILWQPGSGWQFNTIINLGSATEEYGRRSPVITNIGESDGSTADYYYNEDSNFSFKMVGTTVYWYANTSKRHQFNYAVTYAYMAIG